MHVFKLMLNKTQIHTAEDVTSSFSYTLASGHVAMEGKVSRRPEGQARVRRTRSVGEKTSNIQGKVKSICEKNLDKVRMEQWQFQVIFVGVNMKI